MESNAERLKKTVQKECQRLGITFKTQTRPLLKDGKPVIGQDGKPIVQTVNILSDITDDARELLEVLNFGTPCWFKGCESLRKQYAQEKAEQEKKCSGCSGTLTRRYMALARTLLERDPDRTVPKLH